MAEGLKPNEYDRRASFEAGGVREDAFATVLFRATVEHKSEPKCRDSGNLCIEFRQRGGKKSGILVTKAEFWAEEFHDRCWIVAPSEKVKRIAKIICDRDGWQRVGDNENEAVFIPLTEFVSLLNKSDEELRALRDGKCLPIRRETEGGARQ